MAPTNKIKNQKQHPWDTPTIKGQTQKIPQNKKEIRTAL